MKPTTIRPHFRRRVQPTRRRLTAAEIGRLFIAGLLAGVAALMVPAPQATAAADHTPAGGRSSMTAGMATLAAPRHLRNLNSELCMTARAGSGERPVIQTTCDFTQGQSWPDQYWDLNTESVTSVRSVMLNLCVVARGATERAVVATTCGAWPDQQWVPLWNAGIPSDFVLQNVNSKLCLAARGNTESRVVATTCDFMANPPQYWPDQHWEAF